MKARRFLAACMAAVMTMTSMPSDLGSVFAAETVAETVVETAAETVVETAAETAVETADETAALKAAEEADETAADVFEEEADMLTAEEKVAEDDGAAEDSLVIEDEELLDDEAFSDLFDEDIEPESDDTGETEIEDADADEEEAEDVFEESILDPEDYLSEPETEYETEVDEEGNVIEGYNVLSSYVREHAPELRLDEPKEIRLDPEQNGIAYFKFTAPYQATFFFSSSDHRTEEEERDEYGYDNYGYLYDSQGRLICSNDDGASHYQFGIPQTAEEGEVFYLAVRMLSDEDDSGHFMVFVKERKNVDKIVSVNFPTAPLVAHLPYDMETASSRISYCYEDEEEIYTVEPWDYDVYGYYFGCRIESISYDDDDDYLMPGEHTMTVYCRDYDDDNYIDSKEYTFNVLSQDEYFEAYSDHVLTKEEEITMAGNSDGYVFYRYTADSTGMYAFAFSDRPEDQTIRLLNTNGNELDRISGKDTSPSHTEKVALRLTEGQQVILAANAKVTTGDGTGFIARVNVTDGVEPTGMSVTAPEHSVYGEGLKGVQVTLTYDETGDIPAQTLTFGQEYYETKRDSYGNTVTASYEDYYYKLGDVPFEVKCSGMPEQEHDPWYLNVISRLDAGYADSNPVITFPDQDSEEPLVVTLPKKVTTDENGRESAVEQYYKVIVPENEDGEFQLTFTKEPKSTLNVSLYDTDENYQGETGSQSGSDTKTRRYYLKAGTYLMELRNSVDTQLTVEPAVTVAGIELRTSSDEDDMTSPEENLLFYEYSDLIRGLYADVTMSSGDTVYRVWLYDNDFDNGRYLSHTLLDSEGNRVEDKYDCEAGSYILRVYYNDVHADLPVVKMSWFDYMIQTAQPVTEGDFNDNLLDLDAWEETYLRFTAPEDGVYFFAPSEGMYGSFYAKTNSNDEGDYRSISLPCARTLQEDEEVLLRVYNNSYETGDRGILIRNVEDLPQVDDGDVIDLTSHVPVCLSAAPGSVFSLVRNYWAYLKWLIPDKEGWDYIYSNDTFRMMQDKCILYFDQNCSYDEDPEEGFQVRKYPEIGVGEKTLSAADFRDQNAWFVFRAPDNGTGAYSISIPENREVFENGNRVFDLCFQGSLSGFDHNGKEYRMGNLYDGDSIKVECAPGSTFLISLYYYPNNYYSFDESQIDWDGISLVIEETTPVTGKDVQLDKTEFVYMQDRIDIDTLMSYVHASYTWEDENGHEQTGTLSGTQMDENGYVLSREYIHYADEDGNIEENSWTYSVSGTGTYFLRVLFAGETFDLRFTVTNPDLTNVPELKTDGTPVTVHGKENLFLRMQVTERDQYWLMTTGYSQIRIFDGQYLYERNSYSGCYSELGTLDQGTYYLCVTNPYGDDNNENDDIQICAYRAVELETGRMDLSEWTNAGEFSYIFDITEEEAGTYRFETSGTAEGSWRGYLDFYNGTRIINVNYDSTASCMLEAGTYCFTLYYSSYMHSEDPDDGHFLNITKIQTPDNLDVGLSKTDFTFCLDDLETPDDIQRYLKAEYDYTGEDGVSRHYITDAYGAADANGFSFNSFSVFYCENGDTEDPDARQYIYDDFCGPGKYLVITEFAGKEYKAFFTMHDPSEDDYTQLVISDFTPQTGFVANNETKLFLLDAMEGYYYFESPTMLDVNVYDQEYNCTPYRYISSENIRMHEGAWYLRVSNTSGNDVTFSLRKAPFVTDVDNELTYENANCYEFFVPAGEQNTDYTISLNEGFYARLESENGGTVTYRAVTDVPITVTLNAGELYYFTVYTENGARIVGNEGAVLTLTRREYALESVELLLTSGDWMAPYVPKLADLTASYTLSNDETYTVTGGETDERGYGMDDCYFMDDDGGTLMCTTAGEYTLRYRFAGQWYTQTVTVSSIDESRTAKMTAGKVYVLPEETSVWYRFNADEGRYRLYDQIGVVLMEDTEGTPVESGYDRFGSYYDLEAKTYYVYANNYSEDDQAGFIFLKDSDLSVTSGEKTLSLLNGFDYSMHLTVPDDGYYMISSTPGFSMYLYDENNNYMGSAWDSMGVYLNAGIDYRVSLYVNGGETRDADITVSVFGSGVPVVSEASLKQETYRAGLDYPIPEDLYIVYRYMDEEGSIQYETANHVAAEYFAGENISEEDFGVYNEEGQRLEKDDITESGTYTYRYYVMGKVFELPVNFIAIDYNSLESFPMDTNVSLEAGAKDLWALEISQEGEYAIQLEDPEHTRITLYNEQLRKEAVIDEYDPGRDWHGGIVSLREGTYYLQAENKHDPSDYDTEEASFAVYFIEDMEEEDNYFTPPSGGSGKLYRFSVTDLEYGVPLLYGFRTGQTDSFIVVMDAGLERLAWNDDPDYPSLLAIMPEEVCYVYAAWWQPSDESGIVNIYQAFMPDPDKVWLEPEKDVFWTGYSTPLPWNVKVHYEDETGMSRSFILDEGDAEYGIYASDYYITAAGSDTRIELGTYLEAGSYMLHVIIPGCHKTADFTVQEAQFEEEELTGFDLIDNLAAGEDYFYVFRSSTDRDWCLACADENVTVEIARVEPSMYDDESAYPWPYGYETHEAGEWDEYGEGKVYFGLGPEEYVLLHLTASEDGASVALRPEETAIEVDLDDPYQDFTWNGEEQVPDVTVTDQNDTPLEEENFTISYENNVDAGEATVTAIGAGVYQVLTANTIFTITPRYISDTDVNVSEIEPQTYTGEEICPALTISWHGKTLLKGTDYTVEYRSNIMPGEAYADVTGKGNYTGSVTLPFIIEDPSISAEDMHAMALPVTESENMGMLQSEQYLLFEADGLTMVLLETVGARPSDITFYRLDETGEYFDPDHSFVSYDPDWGEYAFLFDEGEIAVCVPAMADVTVQISIPAPQGTSMNLIRSGSYSPPQLYRVDADIDYRYQFTSTQQMSIRAVSMEDGSIGQAVGSTLNSREVNGVETVAFDLEEGSYFYTVDTSGSNGGIFTFSKVDLPEQIEGVLANPDTLAIGVNWAIGNSQDTTYRIYRSENGGEFEMVAQISSHSVTSWKDTDVDLGSAYVYYVTGVYGKYVEGPASEYSDQVSPKEDGEPPTVTTLSVSGGKTRFNGTVTFTALATDNIGVTEMQLWLREKESTGGGDWQLLASSQNGSVSAVVNTADFEKYKEYGTYEVKAVAFDAAGKESSPYIGTYIFDNQAPDQVEGVSLVEAKSVSVTLEWEDLPDTQRNADRSGFRVEQLSDDGETWTLVGNVSDTNGINIFGLVPDTEYTWHVASYDTLGNLGEYSENFTASTLADTTAPRITSHSIVPSGTHDRIKDTVTYHVTAEDDYGIQSIVIQYSQDEETWTELEQKTYAEAASSQKFSASLDTTLLAEGSWYLRAVTEDFAGRSAEGAMYEIIVDRTAPSAPQGVYLYAGDNMNGAYIEVSWDQGTESDLGTYQVWKSADGEDFTRIATGLNTVSYYDYNVSTGQLWYYYVVVTDVAGNVSDPSEIAMAEVVTDETPPEMYSLSPRHDSRVSGMGGSVTVSAAAYDNRALAAITFYYKTDEASEYEQFNEITLEKKDSGILYTSLSTEGMADGQKVYVKAQARDREGLLSEPLESSFTLDMSAPEIVSASVVPGTEERTALISWTGGGEEDVYGYYLYRHVGENTSLVRTVQAIQDTTQYEYTDTRIAALSGQIGYSLIAFDKLGNLSEEVTAGSITLSEPDEEDLLVLPVPVINCDNLLQKNVEYSFSYDNLQEGTTIVSCRYEFGDGTFSTSPNPIHSYSQVGNYTVRLTVTDPDGHTVQAEKEITVREKSTLGAVKITVKDYDGNTVGGAPVYFDLGSENQFMRYTDGSGEVIITSGAGSHMVGCFKDHYLPVSKNVALLAGDTVSCELLIKHEEIVTGEFEIHRMTLDEIKAAHIDINDPANQHVAKVVVHMEYREQTVEIPILFNSEGIIGGTPVRVNFGDETRDIIPGIIWDVSGGGGGGGGGGGSWGWGGSGNDIAVALLDIPVGVSCLKEFFDVKLHIINHADSQFSLVDNTVSLNVPNGLTIMKTNNTLSSATTHIDRISGQSTETLEWILRGDEIGSYMLSADFAGTLETFNARVQARFEAKDPIEVYGLSGCKLTIVIPETISSGSYNDPNAELYYTLRLENEGEVSVYMPTLTCRPGDAYSSLMYNGQEVDDFPTELRVGDYLEIYCRMAVDKRYALYELYNYYYTITGNTGLQVEVITEDNPLEDRSVVVSAAGTGYLLKNQKIMVNHTEYYTDAEGVLYLGGGNVDSYTFQVSGYYDYTVSAERLLGSKGSHKVAMRVVNDQVKLRVASVYFRRDKTADKAAGKWKDGFVDSISVYADDEDAPTYTIAMEADWMDEDEGTYVLSQSSDYKLTSETGEFKNVDLASVFAPGKDIYAYVVNKQGTERSKPEKVNISVKYGKDDLPGILSTGSFKLGSDLEVTIPDDYPIVGGNTFSLNLSSLPIYFEEDNGRIKIGYNISTDDEGYNLFKEYTKKIKKLKDAGEKYEMCKRLSKSFGGGSMYEIIPDTSCEVTLAGYVELEPTGNGWTLVEGEIMMLLDINGSITKQFYQPIPFFLGITLGAKSGATGSATTFIADKDMPFYFDLDITFEPYLKVTGGLGINKVIAVQATGGVSMEFLWKPLIGYVRVMGKADLNVKGYIGPWTFLDKDFWTASKMLYESNIYQEIVDDLVGTYGVDVETAGELAADELMRQMAYDPANYEAQLLSDYEADWYGEVETVEESAIEDPELDLLDGTGERLLQGGVYPDARQSIVQGTDSNGDPVIVMVWLSQDVNRSVQNSTVVVYSVYNMQEDTWSAPLPVDDDGTADLYPKAVSENGQIHVIWQNTSRVLDDDENLLTDLGACSQIAEAVYDPETGTFEKTGSTIEPEAAAGDETQSIFTTPDYVTDGESTYAVWLANDEGNIFGSTGSNAVMAAKRTADGWSEPVEISGSLAMIYDYDCAVYDGTLYVAASVEKPETSEEAEAHPDTILEILTGSWNGSGEATSRWLTNDDTADNEPTIIHEKEKLVLYWNNDGNVKKLVLAGGETGTGIEDSSYIAAVEGRKQVVTDAGTFLMWIGASAENRYATEIYCSVWDEADGTYGSPVCITGLNKYITSFSVAPSRGNRIDVVYQGRTVTETEEGASYSDPAMYCLMITPEADLSVSLSDNLLFSRMYTGEGINMNVDVENHGMFPAEGYVLQLLDPDGNIVVTQEYDTLLESGASEKQDLFYILPVDFVGGDYTVRVTVGAGAETKLGDNTASIEIPGYEISIDSVDTQRSGNTFTVITKVRNTGALPLENVVLTVSTDEEGEQVLGTVTAEEIVHGDICTLPYIIDAADVSSAWNEEGIVRLYLKAASGDISTTGSTVLYADPAAQLVIDLFDHQENETGVSAQLTLRNDSLETKTGDVYAAVTDADDNLLAYAVKKEVEVAAGKSELIELSVEMPLVGDSAEPGAQQRMPLPEGYKVICGEMTPVETITLDREEVMIRLNRDTSLLHATVVPDNALDTGVVWSSADETIAVVDRQGCVTPVAVGETVITATAADGYGAAAQCAVTVRKEHDFTAWETLEAATCTDNGVEVRRCRDDDCTLEEDDPQLRHVLPAFGHKWDEEYTIDVEPTEDTEGQKSFHCSHDPSHIKPNSEVTIPNLKDQRTSAAVIEKINAIGEVSLTEAVETAINEAKAAYNALTETAKALVDNYDVLLAAESVFKQLKDEAAVNAVIEQINRLDAEKPDDALLAKIHADIVALTEDQAALYEENKAAVDKVALADENKARIDAEAAAAVEELINAIDLETPTDAAIRAAETAYKNLTDDQKGLIDAQTELKAKLVTAIDNANAADAAEAAIAAISDTEPTNEAITKAENKYGALTDDQKKLVDAAAVTRLNTALDSQRKAAEVSETLAALNTVVPDDEAIKTAEEAYAGLNAFEKKLVAPAAVSNLEAAQAKKAEVDADAVRAVTDQIDRLNSEMPDDTDLAKIHADINDLTDDQKVLLALNETAVEKLALADENKARIDAEAAAAVEELINAIDLETPTDAVIRAAETAYKNLTNDQKDLIDAQTELKAKLETAVANANAADEVEAAIEAISDTEPTNDAITAAENKYGALTDDQKKLVDAAAVTRLNTALDSQKKAAEVSETLAALNTVVPDDEAIKTAEEAYAGLNAFEKKLVAPAAVSNLEAAQARKAEVDAAAAAGVKDLIDAINMETPTDAAIRAAEEGYEALTADQKALIDAQTELKTKLDTAVENADAADAAEEAIAQISDTEPTNEAITAAQTAYDALTPDQQKLVDSEAVTKLEMALADQAAAAEVAQQIADLKVDDPEAAVPDDTAIKAVEDALAGLSDNQKKLVSDDAKDDLEQARESRDDIDELLELIEAIEEANPTDASIKAASEAYEKLSDKEKSSVSQDAKDKLDEAVEVKEQRDEAAADAVNDKINALNTSNPDEAKINEAEQAYNSLTPDQKKKVSAETLKKLSGAKQALADEKSKGIKVGQTAVVGGFTYKATADGGVMVMKGPDQKTVSIPATVTINRKVYQVTAIADNAFKGKKKLVNVTIGGNIKSVGRNAFAKCKKLKKVAGGAGVVSIGAGAFAGNKKLKSFTITSANLQTIGSKCFKGDKKLKTVKLPKSGVISSVKKAFKGSSVTKVDVLNKMKKAYKKIFAKKASGRNMKLK